MFMRSTALVCALATGAVVLGGEVKNFSLVDLKPGSQFEIATQGFVYRGELVDPTTGEVRLAASTDGVQFTAPQTVYLLGATQGRYAEAGGLMLVKMRQIQNGMGLELGMGSLEQKDRAVTEPIKSIRLQ